VLAAARNPSIAEVWHRTMLRSMIYVRRSMQRTAGASTEPIIARLIDAILARRPADARAAARELTRQMLVDVGMAPTARELRS
jgi:DNA-binding GntR family transcriptional regulator